MYKGMHMKVTDIRLFVADYFEMNFIFVKMFRQTWGSKGRGSPMRWQAEHTISAGGDRPADCINRCSKKVRKAERKDESEIIEEYMEK